ncbi:GH1 family beta-glucosidase [Amycolatopsis sp. YIM 10]|uniref:GH1 family beta-glucosidase n=1 Tax=Amycolatopsis sp. YIM 10 TaxID=2653857 RepID=UPI0012900213|nr:GH1 family beta-glucosidase [Amycolatopsis sp. YIM 10]QFU89151.1 Beta-glucosidase B [Amycolatopsis sp. YIM 10]
MATLRFPPGFTWGASTAAYQIEGAGPPGARGTSIWDTFAARPGRVLNGDNGALACDHYHRYPEDLQLLEALGTGAYRFSVSWSRLQHAGRGPLNQRGIDFYSRLVDGLLDRGIEPWVTLYHLDLPQPLEDAGGWPSRDTALRFADFAAAVHHFLAERVTRFITVNEPWCSALLGYASGEHAPGRTDPAAALRAAHHLLLGHGLALEAVRSIAPVEAGITLNLAPVEAATEHPDDLDAARRVDGLTNRLFLDPVMRGEYPADVVRDLSSISNFGFAADGDLAAISAPMDFLGINYYAPETVYGTPDAPPVAQPSRYPGVSRLGFHHTERRTAMGWSVDATGLTRTLGRLTRDYPHIPLYITENGVAYDDEVTGGQVLDHDRIAYLDEHLRAAHAGITAGADLRGYFVWSLLDNFEWNLGYSKRFGLVHVDFASQERIPKLSAKWYRDVVQANGLD